jgi:hypothetical protein
LVLWRWTRKRLGGISQYNLQGRIVIVGVVSDLLVVGVAGRAETAPNPKEKRKRDAENFMLIM